MTRTRNSSRLIICGLLVTASSLMVPAHAQDKPASAEGYVSDSSGKPVRDSAGECVRSLAGSLALAQDCGESPAPPPVAEKAPAPQPPPPAPQPVPPKPVFEKQTLSGVTLFAFDKAVLKPAGKKEIDKLVAKMKEYPEIRLIRVTGYTDSIGTAAYNLKLSKRRADAVKNYMVEQGVEPGRIETRGMGKQDPVASNKTAVGRAKNRRVEIEIVVQKEVQQ